MAGLASPRMSGQPQGCAPASGQGRQGGRVAEGAPFPVPPASLPAAAASCASAQAGPLIRLEGIKSCTVVAFNFSYLASLAGGDAAACPTAPGGSLGSGGAGRVSSGGDWRPDRASGEVWPADLGAGSGWGPRKEAPPLGPPILLWCSGPQREVLGVLLVHVGAQRGRPWSGRTPRIRAPRASCLGPRARVGACLRLLGQHPTPFSSGSFLMEAALPLGAERCFGPRPRKGRS